ncbi:MAG: conserved membrane protein of unknown function [Rhodospirillaceae bacterium]|nr:MAG: conserved membrane protein of unknown function [Rhodospirillaceae bacterium]
MEEGARAPRFLIPAVWICVVACAFGGLSLALGMDANWDLRNYHYYLPYAFLGQREDILAAQTPTFFNPLLDIPFFLAAESWPARWVGGALGALHGVPFALLLFLARRTLALENPVHRTHLAALIALAGVTGAGALSEVGTVFYDTLLPVGFLSSLLLIVSRGTFMVEGGAGGLLLACVAGVPAGIAAALKLPHAVAAIGVCGAMLAVPGSPPPMRRMLAAQAALAVGVGAGMGVAGGWWHWHLWQVYDNPVFPAFNDVFRSPWAGFESYRGNDFLPAGWGERLAFALVYPFAPERTSEVPFRDVRIATLFVLVPLAVAARLVGRLKGREEKQGRLVHVPPQPAFILPGGRFSPFTATRSGWRCWRRWRWLRPLAG